MLPDGDIWVLDDTTQVRRITRQAAPVPVTAAERDAAIARVKETFKDFPGVNADARLAPWRFASPTIRDDCFCAIVRDDDDVPFIVRARIVRPRGP